MKKYGFFLSIFSLSFCILCHNLYAMSCPNTKVKCFYRLPLQSKYKLYKIVTAGYLFGGKSVPSFWHPLTLGCRPLHYSQSDLIDMCNKIYTDCAQYDCMVAYKKW